MAIIHIMAITTLIRPCRFRSVGEVAGVAGAAADGTVVVAGMAGVVSTAVAVSMAVAGIIENGLSDWSGGL